MTTESQPSSAKSIDGKQQIAREAATDFVINGWQIDASLRELAIETLTKQTLSAIERARKEWDDEESSERCEVCNTELSQCSVQGVDGEPSLDCQVCNLREQLAAERSNLTIVLLHATKLEQELATERQRADDMLAKSVRCQVKAQQTEALVEALEKIATTPLSCYCGHIAHDALAKVTASREATQSKEGK